MALIVYTPEQLAEILGKTTKTLANWRVTYQGPRYVRLGGRGSGVVYRLLAVMQQDADEHWAHYVNVAADTRPT